MHENPNDTKTSQMTQYNMDAKESDDTKAPINSSSHHFVCQKCLQPLKLDQSFENIDDRAYADLTAPVLSMPGHSSKDDSPDDTVVQELIGACASEESEAMKKAPPVRILSTESGNGFTLLGDIGPDSFENISRQMKVTTELFDILSGQSDISHPLCEECTDNLLDLLDQQLKISEDECKDYHKFLDQLSSSEPQSEEKDVDSDIEKYKAEVIELQQQLDSIENERMQIGELTAKEQEVSKKLCEEEKRHFHEYNEYKRQLLEYEDAQKSADNQLKYAKSQLDKLKKTNVFNATFHIWHNGHFGTINNFRLGRLPNVPVEWNEINAAWGQTVLLLYSLANKMNLEFERYKLVPYGNHSYIQPINDKSKELPLYGSGGIKFFWDTKFDQAMVAFLDCLQQFKEAVEKGDTGFSLPYKMEKGKIEDASTGTSYSIKTQFNSEEQWTKALKFMLTNLKWGLAWVSSQFSTK